MTNLRHVSLKALERIRDNNYFSVYLDKQYDPEAIDVEIERKTRRPDKFLRKDKTNFNKIHKTCPKPYEKALDI